MNEKYKSLLKELKERLHDDCAACRKNVKHTFDKKKDIYFYKDAVGNSRECGNSWLRYVVRKYEEI